MKLLIRTSRIFYLILITSGLFGCTGSSDSNQTNADSDSIPNLPTSKYFKLVEIEKRNLPIERGVQLYPNGRRVEPNDNYNSTNKACGIEFECKIQNISKYNFDQTDISCVNTIKWHVNEDNGNGIQAYPHTQSFNEEYTLVSGGDGIWSSNGIKDVKFFCLILDDTHLDEITLTLQAAGSSTSSNLTVAQGSFAEIHFLPDSSYKFFSVKKTYGMTDK